MHFPPAHLLLVRLSVLVLLGTASPAGGQAPATAPADPVNPGGQLAAAARVIPNLQVVAPGLIRGGQPTAEALKLLKDAGVRTVINLRNEEVLVAREAEVARRLGLAHVNIPLNVFDPPADAHVERFLALVSDAARQPVFVHCLHGQDRTGTMVALYRIERQGWTADRAYAEMVALGFHPGFSNLSRAVFDHGRAAGRAGNPPSAAAISTDLRERLLRMIKR